MKSVLQRPVEFVDLRLAPTSELAALAELARLEDHDQQLRTLTRIAHTVRAEDDERARVAALRRRTEPVPLPQRTVG
jgi:hypothetical protein